MSASPQPSTEPASVGLHDIVDAFSQAWRAGQRPNVEDHLPEGHSEQRMVLAELAAVDLGWRLRSGEAARVEEYLQRYPELAKSGEVVLDLIRVEYANRRVTEPDLTAEIYCQRFPQFQEQLQQWPINTPKRKDPVVEFPAVPGYEILGELGRGGMGVVYKARQVSLGRRLVALKMIRDAELADADDLARFQSEAEAVARMQHPGFVQIFETGLYNGLPYFSMEYVEGGNLGDRLQGNPLPPRPAARLVVLLAQAMQAAHEKHILHRDLKPGNVFLMPVKEGGVPIENPLGAGLAPAFGRYLPKIGDFGLAKTLQVEPDEARSASPGHMTHTGALLGTPPYMAPEQAQSRVKEITALTDVYALGATLYELLTGRPPFRAATKLETLIQVVEDEPVPPSQLNARTPRDLETICLKCLQKEPSKRYSSAQVLSEDLERFLKGEPILARPVGRLERSWRWCRRNPAVASLAAAVFLVLLVGSVVASFFALRADANARRAEGKEAEAIKAVGEKDETLQLLKKKVDAEAAAHLEAENNLHEARWSLYQSRLARSAQLFAEDQTTEAQKVLKECPEEFRGWEWRYLRRRFLGTSTILRGHEHPVLNVVYSPDGRLVAAVDKRDILIWDAQTGEQKLRIKGPFLGLGMNQRFLTGHLAFTRDGQRLIIAGWFELNPQRPKGVFNVQVRDVETGKRVEGCEIAGDFLAISPDGTRIAVCRNIEVPFILATTSGLLGSAPSLGPALTALFLARRYGLFVNELAVLSIPEGSSVFTRPLQGHASSLTTAAFSPDGNRLAAVDYTGLSSGHLEIWDLQRQQPTVELNFQLRMPRVTGMAFSSGGDRLAFGSGLFKVWNANTGQELPAVGSRGFTALTTAPCLSPDGGLIAFGAPPGSLGLYGGNVTHGEVLIWDASHGKQWLNLRGHTAPINDVAFSPDGRHLASASDDHTVRIWETDHEPEVDGGKGDLLAFSPDGQLAATIDRKAAERYRKCQVKIWDTKTWGTQQSFSIPFIPFIPQSFWLAEDPAFFDPDGRSLRILGRSKTPGQAFVTNWDMPTGKQQDRVFLRTARPKDSVGTVNFSQDGRRLAGTVAVSRNEKIFSWGPGDPQRIQPTVWDVQTGEIVRSFGIDNPRGNYFIDGGEALTLSPDGERLAVITPYRGSAAIELLDVTSGQRIWLKGTRSYTRSLTANPTFSPDGRWLAFSPGEASITICDAASGKTIREIQDPVADHIYDLAFSPDGKRLVSSGGALQIWDPRTGARVLTVPASGSRGRVSFSPDGRCVWVGNRLWDTKIPDQVEAYEWVRELFDQLPVRSEVIASLEADSKQPATVRKLAVALAQTLEEESPKQLNERSWAVVREEGKDAAAYRLALRQAEVVDRLAPEQGDIVNTLGVAQYRVGKFQEAVATLSRSDTLYKEPQPSNAAVTAMAYHQLGREREARAALDRAHELAKERSSRLDDDSIYLLGEAERLLGRQPKPGEVWLNIAYGDDDKQKLDLYLPDREGFPTVVFTYGGGWHTGSRKSVTAIGEKLQSLGYGCALVSHRLWPPDRFPAQAEDVAEGFVWVKKNIEARKGDPKRVFLMGHSSGAQLSLLLATDPKYLKRYKLSPADIAGVVGLSTPVDLEPRENKKGFGDALMGGKGADAFGQDAALMKDASPIQHVTKDLRPTLLIVGDHDFPMLEDDAKAFAAKAKDVGHDVGVFLAKDCNHTQVARSLLETDGPVLKQVLVFLRDSAEPTRNDKRLSEWIAELKSPDLGVRNNAASVLISFGPEAAPAAKALATTLTDSNADVRRHSALALGAIGPGAADAVDALNKAMRTDANPTVRVWSAYSLFEVSPDRADEAAETLAKIVAGPNAVLDRVNAARALGRMGPKARKAVEPLKLATKDENPEVAAAARKALERIKQE